MRTRTVILALLLFMQAQFLAGEASICEVHDFAGWTVPRVNDPVVLTARQPISSSDPHYAGVYVKIVRPKRRRSMRIPLFTQRNGTLLIRHEFVAVKQLQEFSYRDKPYAYAVEFARVSSTTGAEMGALFRVMYLDLNRDGVFEVMRTCGETFPPPPLSVPESGEKPPATTH